jgi:hypothetical protein
MRVELQRVQIGQQSIEFLFDHAAEQFYLLVM